MTKLQQTLYQLMNEIHEICVKNKITYTLHPRLVLFLKNGLDIPEDFVCRCVYMPADDFHRFVSVCSANLPENRSIESLHSNPTYPELYSARYVNTDTLCLNINEGFNYVNNGLFIRIEMLRSYPKKSFKKKLISMLELGWRENTYQYNNVRYTNKQLISKIAVRCLMLLGRKNLSRILYNYTLKAYKCKNSKYRVCHKDKSMALPKSDFKPKLRRVADNERFYFPSGWKNFLESAYGKKYDRFLDKKYVPARSIIENPYMSSEEFFAQYPQLGEFLKKRMRFRKVVRKSKQLFEYRTYCWTMVNMAGDKFELKSYYDKNRQRIINLNEAKYYKKLMALFKPYYNAQKKYEMYGQTFSIDPEIDEIYYETLRNNGEKIFAEKMKKLL